MKPRTDWTPDRYQQEISKLRLSAHNKRKLADRDDAEADVLKKECAGIQTGALPLFHGATNEQ